MRREVVGVFAAAAAGCSAPASPATLPPVSHVGVIPTAAPAGSSPQDVSAFARWYFDQIDQAYLRTDPTVLAAASDPGCQSCARFVADVRSLGADHLHVTGPAFVVLDAEAPPVDGGSATVDVVYRCPPQPEFAADGHLVSQVPGTGVGTIVVSLVRSADGSWRVRRMQRA